MSQKRQRTAALSKNASIDGSATPSKKKQPPAPADSDGDDNAIDSERDEPQEMKEMKHTPKKQVCLPYDSFKELVNQSQLFKSLREYGSRLVPLSLVGMFMNYAGNHLLHYIYVTYKTKVFHHGHKVVGVQLLGNGEFLTTSIKT